MKSFKLRTDKFTFVIKRDLQVCEILVLKDYEVQYRFDIFSHRNLVLPVDVQFNNVHTVDDLKKFIEIHGKEIERVISC